MPTYPPRQPMKQATGTSTGACPRCGPGMVSIFECERCHGSGVITFSLSWTPQEDAKLRTAVEAGHSWSQVAIQVDKPQAVCRSRAAVLGIKSMRPEPGAFFIVRPSHVDPNAPAIDVADPAALHDEAVRP